jgi:glycine reductase complex component B subunit gamma
MLRVVHYLNQFFGGMGGEEKAEAGPQVREGLLGPGMAIQKALGEAGKVVATVTCGDNYFAENIERASGEVCELIRAFRPDLLIAGPAFNAGRYGIACGAVCQAAIHELKIPAVTGMHSENPGVDLYRLEVYILSTQESVKGMNEAVSGMVKLGLRLAAGEKIGRPSEEGYFPRGLLVNEVSERSGAERVVSMLLRKLAGQPFESEVPRPAYDRVTPAPGVRELSRAKIALLTDGGLVPRGNPDRIEARTATRFGKYPISGKEALSPEGYEVSHVGYDSVFVKQDPNRLVPVDVMREFEKEGRIGELHGEFYSTTGVANVVETMSRMGRSIAGELKAEGVSGVILTST